MKYFTESNPKSYIQLAIFSDAMACLVEKEIIPEGQIEDNQWSRKWEKVQGIVVMELRCLTIEIMNLFKEVMYLLLPLEGQEF